MDTAHKEITARVTTVDIRLGLSRPVLRLVQPQAQRSPLRDRLIPIPITHRRITRRTIVGSLLKILARPAWQC